MLGSSAAAILLSALAASPAPAPYGSSQFGLYVYANQGQSKSQQSGDESACYTSASATSGVDPLNLPPATPGPQATHKGGAVRGAARGAAGGALIGAITGNAGEGAAVGAAAGGVGGYARQKRLNEAEQQYAQANVQQQQSQKMNSFRRAYSACLESKGYTVR